MIAEAAAYVNSARPRAPARDVFHIDRALEFFSTDELAKQIGHGRPEWAPALLAELIANGLDAMEKHPADTPSITVDIGPDHFAVADSGPGVPWALVEDSLDYQYRVSDKAFYVGPTRGCQGNAWKCLWAAPFVDSDGERSAVGVEAHGQRREVVVEFDPVAQKHRLFLTPAAPSVVKIGSKFTVPWVGAAGLLAPRPGRHFYHAEFSDDSGTEVIEAGMRSASMLVRAAALFNPDVNFVLELGGQRHEYAARSRGWKKWTQGDPSPVQWYTLEQFGALMAACLRADQRVARRPRSVREFMGQFRGMSGTQKRQQACEAAGIRAGDTVEDVLQRAGAPAALWGQMRVATDDRAPGPKHLGAIGKEAFVAGMTCAFGCDTADYRKAEGTDGVGVPWVLEVGFGYLEHGRAGAFPVGVNWAPALNVPFDAITGAMAESLIAPDDPVCLAVHLAYPGARALDRGKTRFEVGHEVEAAVRELVKAVAKGWRRAKAENAKTQRRVSRERLEVAARGDRDKKSLIKDLAAELMPEAYRIASEGVGLAEARQVMYAARKLIIARTGDPVPWKNSSYFTQKLLPDYMAENPDTTAGWDIVFSDRGHFAEPHTGKRIGLGTLAVRGYAREWGECEPGGEIASHAISSAYPTCGPRNRFGFALFVEKEGFDHHIERLRLQERYDVALMSTKGMTVTAARQLIEHLAEEGVTILVARDFDVSGFNILHSTYTSGRRYKFRTKPKVIDLGLRLEDVTRLGLTGEEVEYTQQKNPRERLMKHGANEAECAFLIREPIGSRGWAGVRVELNELAGQMFTDFIEAKFAEHGVAKLVPGADTLSAAFERAGRIAHINRAITLAAAEAERLVVRPPSDLAAQVRQLLADSPAIAWDEAVARVVEEVTAVLPVQTKQMRDASRAANMLMADPARSDEDIAVEARCTARQVNRARKALVRAGVLGGLSGSGKGGGE